MRWFCRRFFFTATFLWLFGAQPGFTGIIVVLKNGSAKIYDAKTGAYRGTISAGDVVYAASDGEVIVVVTHSGWVKRYDSKGAYKGQVGSGKAVSVQVSSGLIIVTGKDGRIKRYDVRTGAYKGSF